MTKPDCLRGWKSIAAHLDVSVRTAQTWAARGINPLPVYAVDSRVEASVAEVDRWDAARRKPFAPARRGRAA